jgi:hypothetical protein
VCLPPVLDITHYPEDMIVRYTRYKAFYNLMIKTQSFNVTLPLDCNLHKVFILPLENIRGRLEKVGIG